MDLNILENTLMRAFSVGRYSIWSDYQKAGIMLMVDEGLRVSDMLKLTWQNVSNDGRVIVRQGKSSATLVVTPRFYSDVWRRFAVSKASMCYYLNYMQIYRMFRDLGLSLEEHENGNASVTHIGRKLVAREVYRVAGNIDDSAAALGHKSTRSTQYYIQKRSAVNRGNVLNSDLPLDGGLVVCKNAVVKLKATRKKKRLK